MENTEPIRISGARPTVEITGVHGVFYKILLDGEPLKPIKGRWLIPMRNGNTKEMRARGFIPGFQRLFVEGEQVFDMAGDVTMLQRVLMFLPLALLFINPALGLPLSLLMFFLHVSLMKNPHMPRILRIILPITNTAAAALMLVLLENAIAA